MFSLGMIRLERKIRPDQLDKFVEVGYSCIGMYPFPKFNMIVSALS